MKPLPLDLSQASLKPFDTKHTELLLNLNSGSSPRLMEKVTHQLQSGLPSDSSKKSGSKHSYKNFDGNKVLEELFSFAYFDEKSARFIIHTERPNAKRKVGEFADYDNKHGYLCLWIFSRIFRAHSIIWLIAFGDWPKGEIDHINGNRSDNRLQNLRDVSHQENLSNRTVLPKNNTSGISGIYLNKRDNKWVAYTRLKGRMKYLGQSLDKEEAIAILTRYKNAHN